MAKSEQAIDSTVDILDADWPWQAGALAGAIATVATTIVIAVVDIAIIDQVAGLYGMEGNVVAGAVLHLLHGTVFGALFAMIVADPPISPDTGRRWLFPLGGLVYGVVLAIVGAGIIMPIWLGEVGYTADAAIQIPYVTIGTLTWHAVFGLVLGALFPVLADRQRLLERLPGSSA
jgi:hypothetical protein